MANNSAVITDLAAEGMALEDRTLVDTQEEDFESLLPRGKWVTAAEAAKAMGCFSALRIRFDDWDWECHQSLASAQRHLEGMTGSHHAILWWCHRDLIGSDLRLEEGHDTPFVVGGDDESSWEGYPPSQVLQAELESGWYWGGSRLRWNRLGYTPDGEAWGELLFIPSTGYFGYPGEYFDAWERAIELEL